MQVRGGCYDGRSSKRSDAALELATDGLLTLLIDGHPVDAASLDRVVVSDRVGNVPRSVRFPSGAVFETTDNEAIDQALTRFGLARGTSFVHGIESRWRFVSVLVVLVAGALWSSVTYGLPLLAKRLAFALPASVTRAVAGGGLEVLDRTLFAPSQLPEATQSRLRARFETMLRETGAAEKSELLFRRSPALGANAFALPSGSVVFTDAIVELADNDDELAAVLAHELGHVVHRHALRHVLQSSTVALLSLAIANDAGAVSSAVIAFPTVLVETRFSREFEREADAFALSYLESRALDPVLFVHLLERIEAQQEQTGDGLAVSFLSTHPSTAERRVQFGAQPGPR